MEVELDAVVVELGAGEVEVVDVVGLVKGELGSVVDVVVVLV